MLDYDRFDVLSFDCYGTLIDWETGLLVALRTALPESTLADDDLLEEFARHEAEAERGTYRPYREVLGAGLRGVANREETEVNDDVVARFSESVRDWPAFPDSHDALVLLQERFRLVVITNCDADLFEASRERLGVVFDEVVTAEAAGAYKPSERPFELAFATVEVPRERWLHVAQSLFHDHVTATRLGLSTVWIDRRHDRPGTGATPPASAEPNATYPSMAAFADAASQAVDSL